MGTTWHKVGVVTPPEGRELIISGLLWKNGGVSSDRYLEVAVYRGGEFLELDGDGIPRDEFCNVTHFMLVDHPDGVKPRSL